MLSGRFLFEGLSMTCAAARITLLLVTITLCKPDKEYDYDATY